MKPKKLTIFRRFAIVILSLVTILGFFFILITYFSTTNYHLASTQLLNKDVAQHVAEYTSAFTSSGLNQRRADSVFKNAMVLNPNAEVYFLDTTGKVIYFDAAEKDIRNWNIDLLPLKKYIDANGERYIKGDDPKDPVNPKIFSVARVSGIGREMGYIYVILGSKRSDGITGLLFGSHVLDLAIKAFIAVIILSLLFSFLYLKRVRKNFDHMISVLERFESGDYTARFGLRKQDELEPVTHAFNKMAHLLSSSISRLTSSEQERKNFIAIISHDLRTPLSIARGYMETLLMQKEKGNITKEEQENYFQLIYNKILQIENMVKELFELSKMDAVEFRPRKEPFVLSEIVQESINMFQMIAAEKKVRLKCAQCLYHVWVDADVSMMERVVQNLIDNALKNTPEEGIILASLSVENNELIFKIVNDGTPIPGDLLQWINNFGKTKGAITGQHFNKQGLGLLIVQKILDLHNTSLKAHSDGQNIFTFSLPIYNLPS